MPPELPPSASGLPLRIGRYEVIGHLATGGMAQIYLARQTGLGSFERHVVLKTIVRERASDQRFVNMFLDEAKLAATLNHQNVAQVYEVDQADGAYFMAMEYVHGENARAILETSIRRGWTIPLELAVMIIGGAAAGLHHAHERKGKNGAPLNIVHRDVSPANIMVGYDGSIKVLDFGIAKAEERATKTVGGTIKGKYGYMSPEQCKGKPIDRRSDIFALGIVLYELTTLRRAFKGNDDFETMKRIVAGDVVPPSVAVPGYPRELEAIILTALANDPAARFQTASELGEALDSFTVRSKQSGSATAMGRFMQQLFGTKLEPWNEKRADKPGEATQIGGGEVDEENEKTILVEGRPDVMRVRHETERDPRDETERVPLEAAPTELVSRAPVRPGPAQPATDASAWQANTPPAMRASARFAAPVPRVDRTSSPPMEPPAPPGRVTPVPASGSQPPFTPEPHGLPPAQPRETLAGVAPVRVSAAMPVQPLMPLDTEISEIGAKPLVTWSTHTAENRSMIPAPPPPMATSASVEDPESYKIRSSKVWLIVAIILVLCVAGAVTAITLAG